MSSASLHSSRESADNPNPPSEIPSRERIVTAARQHFFAHGFRSVTMDDLAAELGMSKKTLYAHFPGKAALLQAVILDKGRQIEEDLDRIAADCEADFEASLQRMLACMQEHTGEISPPFVRDMRKESPEFFTIVEKRRREIFERFFNKLFLEGRKAGFIRKDIPVKIILEILLGATEAMMNPQRISELGLTPKTGYAAIISVILDGVIVRKTPTKG